MRSFVCHHYWNNKRDEKWMAMVTNITQHDSWCEFFIESRSTIHVLVSNGENGRIVAVPDWRASCWLSNPSDLATNKGKLGRIMKNIVDGTTVAYALQNMADLIP